MEHEASENQNWLWLRDRIESMKAAVPEDPEAGLQFFRLAQKKGQVGNSLPIVQKRDEAYAENFFKTASVWVVDINADQSDDLIVLSHAGSQNCASIDILLTSGGLLSSPSAAQLLGEQIERMSWCSGSGQIVGIKPVSIGGDVYVLTYSLATEAGRVQLVQFSADGDFLVRETARVAFVTQRYAQDRKVSRKSGCTLEVCLKGLEAAMPEIDLMFEKGLSGKQGHSALVRSFVDSYQNTGLAKNTTAHSWGQYSEYGARFDGFEFAGQRYVLKVAPVSLGWREWCCGVSVYKPHQNSFTPVGHMFVVAVKRMELVEGLDDD